MDTQTGITGFEEQNLRLWEKGYDSKMKSYQEDLRGQGLQVSEGFIDFIVATAKEYLSQQKRKKRLNKVHRERMEFFGSGKSRRVITEILVANGLYEEKLSLIEDIMTRSCLLVEDRDRFIKTMLKYDEKAIRQAEADFFALRRRDTGYRKHLISFNFSGKILN